LRFVRIECLLQAIAHAPFETMALAHGQNFGAGVDLIAACTQRLADPNARFLMPGLRFGLVLGTRRYAALVGATRARRVLNDGINFSAEEALRDGFVTALTPTDAWDEVTRQAGDMTSRLLPETAARLLAVTATETRDADLAELVRSAATPGIKERIRAYRIG
jgi:enoyl-CoA hydratase/carnithine racemase